MEEKLTTVVVPTPKIASVDNPPVRDAVMEIIENKTPHGMTLPDSMVMVNVENETSEEELNEGR